MPRDQHYKTPDQDVPVALQDRKGTDMPAARSILVVILGMATAVVLFMTIRYTVADGDKRDAAPAQQFLVR